MVSSTLSPAVHTLGSQNVYSRVEGIADHCWPWAVFFDYFPSVLISADASRISLRQCIDDIRQPHDVRKSFYTVADFLYELWIVNPYTSVMTHGGSGGPIRGQGSSSTVKNEMVLI